MNKNRPNRVTLVVLIAIGCLILVAWSLIPGSALNQVISPVTRIVEPLQRQVANLRDRWSGVQTSLQEGDELQRQNEALRLENAELKQKIRAFEADKLKYQEVKEALNIKEQFPNAEVIHANVMSTGQQALYEAFRIDRGSQDNLTFKNATGAAVVDAEMNLVGRIFLLEPTQAKVLPLVAEGAVVSGKVNRAGGAQVRVHGDTLLFKDGLAMVDQIVEGPGLNVGDEIVTSGAGGYYPAGLTIGRIRSINDGPTGKWAELEPYADFRHLSNVFILEDGEADTSEEESAGTGLD